MRAIGSENVVTLIRVTVTPDVQMTFSVAAQPRVYALLLGSGISKAAGVPTGWEVAEDLARRLADQQDADPGGDPIGWYKSWSGENPDYPSLVEALAPSPADRRNLLRSYFEATSDDEESHAPVPSSAHRSIASLVAQGLVSVIVTTNFDRLLERAIADAGNEPVVIATPDAAQGAEPFAHTDITIIKVNGDYLSPNLKNTVEELSSYDEDTDRVLDQVFDQYGLIVCGWSADWDTALHSALCRARSRRYSTYWMHRDPLGEHATRLVAQTGAIAVPIDDADSAFGALADGVAALRAARERHPPTTDLAVGRLKLYLPDPLNRIKLHDLLESETEAVIKHLAEGEAPVQESPTADGWSTWIDEKLAFYESATARLLRLLAIGARFSDSAHHHDLWAQCVDRLANRSFPIRKAPPAAHELQAYPAVLALLAVAMGSAAADNVAPLCPTLTGVTMRRPPIPSAVPTDPFPVFCAIDYVYANQYIAGVTGGELFVSKRLPDVLRPVTVDVVPDVVRFAELFDEVEYLLAVVYNGQRSRFPWRAIYHTASHRMRLDDSPLPRGLLDRHRDALIDHAVFESGHDLAFARDRYHGTFADPPICLNLSGEE